MPKKKKIKRSPNSSLGIKRFNKVLKQSIKQINRTHKNISYESKRRYVIEHVYPALKDVPTRKITLKLIDKTTLRVEKYIEPSDIKIGVTRGNNVDDLAWGEMMGVDFWQLQTVIETVLPNKLTIRINAGFLGIIDNFKVKDWKKVIKRWRIILSKIKTLARTNKKPSGQSGVYYWFPILRHLHGMPDNRHIENNMIEFGLTSMKKQEGDIFEVPKNYKNEEIKINATGGLPKGSKKRKLVDKFYKNISKSKKEFGKRNKRKREELKKKNEEKIRKAVSKKMSGFESQIKKALVKELGLEKANQILKSAKQSKKGSSKNKKK